MVRGNGVIARIIINFDVSTTCRQFDVFALPVNIYGASGLSKLFITQKADN